MRVNSDGGNEEGTIRRILGEYAQTLRKGVVNGRRARVIIPLVLVGILVSVSLAEQTFQEGVASSGTVKVVGVTMFWDRACASKVSSITWGMVTPGTSVTKYVFVQNDGTATGKLSMSFGNWTPSSAGSYFTFAWNCTNYVLSRNAVVCARLVLRAMSNISGVKDFAFMIFVQAAG